MSTRQSNHAWICVAVILLGAFTVMGLLFGPPRPDASAQAPAKALRWEYKGMYSPDLMKGAAPETLGAKFAESCNRFAEDGWQYDGMPALGIVLFKRPK